MDRKSSAPHGRGFSGKSAEPAVPLWRRLRAWHVGVAAWLVWIFVVSFLKSAWVTDFSENKLEFVARNNPALVRLFQSSFVTSYDDQFSPALANFMASDSELKELRIVSPLGQVVFDSKELGHERIAPYPAESRLLPRSRIPQSIDDGSGLGVLVSSDGYGFYYLFATRQILLRAVLLWFVGTLVLGIAIWFLSGSRQGLVQARMRRVVTALSFTGLRAKFVLVIVLVNLFVGVVIYFTQGHLQKKWLTDRTIRSSVLAAESSRDQIIGLFSTAYFFNFSDRFVPAMRQIMGSRDNLTAIRIISRKDDSILFDSDDLTAGRKASGPLETVRAGLSEELKTELRTKPTWWEVVRTPRGESALRVVTSYINESRETPFLVEYMFSFSSLNQWIDSLQRQIFFDMLVPSLILGVLMALLFAHLVVAPVRRLVEATRLVAGGHYDVTLETSQKDEIAELMRAFSAMTLELKKKTELKKYLSDQSYRRIVEGAGSTANVTGARVAATILYCDIRNFANVCELLDAEEVTSLLNDYFSNMVDVIYKHKGEVDKFIGDAILAVFYEQGETTHSANTALNAIYCGMEMREKLSEFNSKRVSADKTAVEIGIGITSGEIISGPIGSPDRMDFTVIGDVVNLASRIEKLSKKGQHTRIVFSNHVEERVRGLLDYEELTREKIRGKEEDIIVYELVKIRDVKDLLSQLSSPDPGIKKHCIELLGYSRNRDALPALYQKLSDSDEAVRIAAVAAAARLAPREHQETLDVLFGHLQQEEAGRVISAILLSLGRLCHSSRLLEIARFLRHSDDRIVANAIEALGSSDDPKVIDLLIPFITSKSNRVKANAAMVLFAKGRIEVMEALKPMLLHSDPLMRASAAFALGELTVMATGESIAVRIRDDARLAKHFLAELQGCVPLLVSLLKDNEPAVKRQVVVALGKIKDKTSVLPLIDNLDVKTDSKELVRDVAEALRSIGSHRLVREVIKQMV